MSSSASIALRSVVFDCPEPPALAAFYAQLLDGRVEAADPEWCEVHAGGQALKLAFQLANPYRPPRWPDGSPQQLHLDFTVTDLDAAGHQATSLGATPMTGRVEEPGCVYVVYADPAGHPFCLCQER
jgi:predicted enzyme related to lactoylglutathione lyase